MIQNPILPGFCPDPSIIRVGEDYYIANSSFEWWPGVKIYHSKDLKHYEQLPSPLNRMSQLNMVGERFRCCPASGCILLYYRSLSTTLVKLSYSSTIR